MNRFKIVAICTAPLLVGAAFWSDTLWFLAGFMLVPLFWGIEPLSKKHSLFAFCYFTAVSALVLAFPLFNFRSVQSFSIDEKTAGILFIIILGWALFLGLLAALTFFVSFSAIKNPLARVFLVPVLWVVFELIKTKLSFDLQWMFVGEPLVEFPALAVYARFGGSYLLSFLAMLLNISLYESLRYLVLRRFLWRYVPIAALGFMVLLLIAGGSSFTKKSAAGGGSIRVALVQPGSMFGVKPDDYYSVLQSRTEKILADSALFPNPDLLIIPGNYFSSKHQGAVESGQIPELANPLSFANSVLVGFSLRRGEELFQTNALFSQKEKIQLAFKQYLLPFSEYTPKIFHPLYALPVGVPKYTAKESNVVKISNGVAIGAISCSEEFVPLVARKAKKDGAKFLVITGSNDDFISSTAFKETLRAARFRAIENNVYVITALKSGISAIIDPNGRVLKQLGQDEQGVLNFEIPL